LCLENGRAFERVNVQSELSKSEILAPDNVWLSRPLSAQESVEFFGLRRPKPTLETGGNDEQNGWFSE
jgi:hypothetical protein